MNLLLPRVAAAIAALAAGAGVGGLLGRFSGVALGGAISGAVLALGILVLLDAWRGQRLIDWLRGPQDGQAPRDAGLWGELGYRVERALRTRDLQIVQEQQRLSEFLSAIEASPNGVMILDADEQIDWCNSPAADHFGIDPERDLRQPITNLVRAPAFVAYLQSGVFDAPVVMTGLRNRATLSVMVCHYGDGHKLVLSRDITEHERTDAMRRDFVANVSHEIRTPLTVLSGFVETMATVPLSSVEQPRVLSLMRQQTERIQSLVDDLLTLAQLEGSPRPAADAWIDLAPLWAQLQADAHALSGGRHRLDFKIEPGYLVAGSESELASATGNLISNAIRYSPAGGDVTVHWRRRESDGCGEFEVRDTGIGIAREHLSRLTERFYRVDGSRSRDTGGTGLGLAIVKHVVQRHGGEFEIQSEPGKGSTFTLVLPAARLRAASVESAAAVQPVSV